MSNTARRVFGALNTAVAALALWGGAQEVAAYWGREVLPVVLGTAGVAAGALLAASGLALWTAHRALRPVSLLAGAATIVVHGTGVLLGIVGYGALLVAVAYPAVMMRWVARNVPPSPAPDTIDPEKGSAAEGPGPNGQRREAAVFAG